MIRKTQALVLRSHPFGDTSLTVQLYTREYGRVDGLVKGVRSGKGRQRHSLYQPLSWIESVYYEKPSRDLQLISDGHFVQCWQRLHTDPVAVLYGLLVAELLALCLRDTPADQALFDAQTQALCQLDSLPAGGQYRWLLDWLVSLTARLGFQPIVQVADPNCLLHFDMAEGRLYDQAATDPDPRLPHLLCLLRQQALPPMDGTTRLGLLQLLLDYLAHHIPSFRMPNSLAVFQSIFAK